ncbi:unnamed protein product, partial [Choristocarpus tenellus]
MGRICVVVSLNMQDGLAEVVLRTDNSGGGGAQKPCSVPLDSLVAVPDVPVRVDALPAGLAKRTLETLTLWCLDETLEGAFSPESEEVAASGGESGGSVPGHEEKLGHSTGLKDILMNKALDRNLLMGLVRFQAAKAAQELLLHPPTAAEFVRSASHTSHSSCGVGSVVGRRCAGAVLLQSATAVTPSAGLGDVGALEELLSMLLAHWHFCVVDGRGRRVQEARDRSRQTADVVQDVQGQTEESSKLRHPGGKGQGDGDGRQKRQDASATEADEGLGSQSEETRGHGGGGGGEEQEDVEKMDAEEDEVNPLSAHMAEMGFPLHWCQRALVETGNNIEAALSWILSNGDVLTVEDSLRENIEPQSQAVTEATVDADADAESTGTEEEG